MGREGVGDAPKAFQLSGRVPSHLAGLGGLPEYRETINLGAVGAVAVGLVCYLAARALEGDLDLSELSDRFTSGGRRR